MTLDILTVAEALRSKIETAWSNIEGTPVVTLEDLGEANATKYGKDRYWATLVRQKITQAEQSIGPDTVTVQASFQFGIYGEGTDVTARIQHLHTLADAAAQAIPLSFNGQNGEVFFIECTEVAFNCDNIDNAESTHNVIMPITAQYPAASIAG